MFRALGAFQFFLEHSFDMIYKYKGKMHAFLIGQFTPSHPPFPHGCILMKGGTTELRQIDRCTENLNVTKRRYGEQIFLSVLWPFIKLRLCCNIKIHKLSGKVKNTVLSCPSEGSCKDQMTN